jgi:hypothetical protein
VCHIAKIEFPDRKRWLIANLHATSLTADRRLANAELGRAVKFIDRQAETEETVVIAGDFNIPLGESEVLGELTTRPDERYAAVAQGATQILMRGRITLSGLRLWPEAERMLDGRVLSDHPPVEVDVVYRVRKQAPPPEEERPKLPSLDEAQRAAPLTPPEPPVAPSPPVEPSRPVEPSPAAEPQPRAVAPQLAPVEPPAAAEPQPTPVKPEPTPVEPEPKAQA